MERKGGGERSRKKGEAYRTLTAKLKLMNHMDPRQGRICLRRFFPLHFHSSCNHPRVPFFGARKQPGEKEGWRRGIHEFFDRLSGGFSL